VGLSVNAFAFLFCLVVGPLLGIYFLWTLLMALGLTQLVYIVPLILIARSNGRPGKVKGLIIAASITLLLNAACWSLNWRG
jgi:hypothetical protein